MKKLQNNFTTPEQSKRLLELGAPIKSADCYFGSYPGHPDWAVIRQSEFDTEDDALFRLNEDITPCWSAGRLMEIYLICKTNNAMGLHFSENDDWDEEIIEGMCDLFSAAVRCGYIDFSKLED